MLKSDDIRVILGKSQVIKRLLSPLNKWVIDRKKNKMNKLFRRKADDIFRKVYNALDSEIEFWPEFGTLLGIYRENDFLKHDFDFDFGAFIQDAKIIRQQLLDAGFEIHCEYYGIEHPEIYEMTFCYENVQIDFFFFNRKNKKTYCTYTFALHHKSNSTNGYIYKVKEYSYPAFRLINREFKGINILIPDDCVSHLSVSYGSDFMIPNPAFTTIHHTYMNNVYVESKYY